MLDLAGRGEREEIAVRIADGVERVLPLLRKDRLASLPLAHLVETVELPRRRLTEQDVAEALRQAGPWREKYEALKAEIEADPSLRDKPRWYVDVTRAYRRMQWHQAVAERFQQQKTRPALLADVHVVRLGELAFATNPFEYFLDFGVQIQARSPAVQTFVVQLAGPGSYVPTERAIAGQGYGAVPASTPIGPDGGRALAERTIELLHRLWRT